MGDPAARRIAVNRGGVLEVWARDRFGGRELVTVDDNDELPRLLAGGEVEAFVTDSFEAPHFRRAQDPLDCAPATERKVLWLAPRAVDLAPAVDDWIRRREPWLREQRRRHFGAAMPRDDLDHLIDLMARRLAVMPHVAAWKRERGEPIEDPPREAAVLEAARRAAESRGLEPDGVKALFRAQIEIAKSVQARAPSMSSALDLQRDLRPLLTRLGDDIVEVLASMKPPSSSAVDDRSRWLPVVAWLQGDEERQALARAVAGVRRVRSQRAQGCCPTLNSTPAFTEKPERSRTRLARNVVSPVTGTLGPAMISQFW